VRELFKLMVAMNSKENKVTLSSLYDKIETQLRALETLGVATHKYGREVDWWSVGIVMYEMMLGFYDGSVFIQPTQYPEYLSKEAISILRMFLIKKLRFLGG
jgi:serine/threonine protein kinase